MWPTGGHFSNTYRNGANQRTNKANRIKTKRHKAKRKAEWSKAKKRASKQSKAKQIKFSRTEQRKHTRAKQGRTKQSGTKRCNTDQNRAEVLGGEDGMQEFLLVFWEGPGKGKGILELHNSLRKYFDLLTIV